MLLGIEQKKGDSKLLCGKLVAYAKILPAQEAELAPTPFKEMSKTGFLVIEGDFRANSDFREFLKKEFGQNFDEKISGLIEHLQEEGQELPEDLNPDSIKERLNEISNMEIIPIPAKIVNKATEEDILKSDGDIYYIGEFQGVNQAHFCLTSLPIFYQAKYREQEKASEQIYLNDLLLQIENQKVLDNAEIKEETDLFPEGASLNSFIGNLQELFDTRIIPYFLSLESGNEFEKAFTSFENFMEPYPAKADLNLLKTTLLTLKQDQGNEKERKRLELLCHKISAAYHEDFRKIPEILAELKKLDTE